MSEKFTTQTASLKATTADVRIINAKTIDAKNIKLNGTNIEDLLSSAGSNIIIEDGREVKTKYDIWEHAAVENEDGSITVKNLYIPDASRWNADFGEELKINGPLFVDNKDDFHGVSRAIIKNKLYINDETVPGGSGWIDMTSITYADIDPENPGEPIASFDTNKIVDGSSLFEICVGYSVGENNTFAHCYIESNFDNLKNGELMFGNYGGVPQHKLDFISNLPNLVNGSKMFFAMEVKTFSSDKNGSKVNLDNLEIGDDMFDATYNGQYIHDQIEALPKLKSSDFMFGFASSPSKWTLSLPSLENGRYMFGTENNVKEFYSDLPKLKNGYDMLYKCEKFRGSLPSLENGYCMFGNSWGSRVGLDSESLLCIVNTLPSRVGLTNTDGENGQGYITISLACDDADESRDAFVQEVGWDNWQQMYDELTHATEGKNWTAQFSFAGSPSASYSLRNPKPISKVWAKVEEVIVPTDEEIEEARKNRIIVRKPHWTHTSDDGKHYVLHAHHMSNDNTGYTQFDSLEAAEEHYGLIRKEESAN